MVGTQRAPDKHRHLVVDGGLVERDRSARSLCGDQEPTLD